MKLGVGDFREFNNEELLLIQMSKSWFRWLRWCWGEYFVARTFAIAELVWRVEVKVTEACLHCWLFLVLIHKLMQFCWLNSLHNFFASWYIAHILVFQYFLHHNLYIDIPHKGKLLMPVAKENNVIAMVTLTFLPSLNHIFGK